MAIVNSDLTNANLASAIINYSTDFSGSDFAGANFRNNDSPAPATTVSTTPPTGRLPRR
jgi:hypothetical protein